MNITPVSFYTHKAPVAFSSKLVIGERIEPSATPVSKRAPLLNGQFYLNTGSVFRGGTTCFFSRDVRWKDFANYIQDRFQGCDKINTYDYGSANGSEALSFNMILDKWIDSPSRFYPIMARDITDETVKSLGRKNLLFSKREYIATKSALGLDDDEMKNYFIEGKNKSKDNRFRLNDKFRNNITFKVANILDDIDSIDSKNPSIVMCRNMWPYINSNEYRGYAKELYKQLAVGSIVVIGGFDNVGAYKIAASSTFNIALKKAGFKPVEDLKSHGISIVYEKN